MSSPTTTPPTSIPTHPNTVLTDTEVANEKNPDSKAHDNAGEPPRRTDRDSEDTTEDGESGDVFWVDWEGPEDPANPKKCVVVLF